MRILLLGKIGQLGWELQRALPTLGKVVALDYPELDLLQLSRIPQIVRDIQPDVIINSTAYTAVDQAEREPDKAQTINGLAPGVLAEAARVRGAVFIHFSTDYVFDGHKGSPYLESDRPNPLCVYGSSKLAGEQAVAEVGGVYLILRTSWVYSLRRDSFVTKVLQWARQKDQLRIVSDQVSNPTWARMLAEVTAQLLAKASRQSTVTKGRLPAAEYSDTAGLHDWLGECSGLYHLAGSGFASRLDWASAILKYDPRPQEQLARALLPASTLEFPSPAQRPLFSALNCDHFTDTFGLLLPPWEEALKLAMEAE
jgi:dTDP-4-dehydrorhamnose reductase